MKVLLIADPHFGLTLTGTNLIPKELKDEKFIISLENKFQFFIEDINNPYTLLLLKSFVHKAVERKIVINVKLPKM